MIEVIDVLLGWRSCSLSYTITLAIVNLCPFSFFDFRRLRKQESYIIQPQLYPLQLQQPITHFFNLHLTCLLASPCINTNPLNSMETGFFKARRLCVVFCWTWAALLLGPGIPCCWLR